MIGTRRLVTKSDLGLLELFAARKARECFAHARRSLIRARFCKAWGYEASLLHQVHQARQFRRIAHAWRSLAKWRTPW